MAAKGLCLSSVGFCRYDFEDCVPGEYRICLQLLDNLPQHPEGQQYISFLESTGAEYVGSFSRWGYFRKKTADGDLALFSDNASRIRYLSGIIRFVSTITFLNLMIGMYNLYLLFAHASSLNYLGFLNLMVSILGTIGTVALIRKRSRIEKQAQLFE